MKFSQLVCEMSITGKLGLNFLKVRTSSDLKDQVGGRATKQTTFERCFLLLAVYLALGASAIQVIADGGVEIPITFYILNAGPHVDGLEILDEEGIQTEFIDPGVPFSIQVRARDNNTAEDILNIKVVMYSPRSELDADDSPSDHYTFEWVQGQGFQGVNLLIEDCISPTNLSGANANWLFRGRVNRTAWASEWFVFVAVSDEEKEANLTRRFTINRYLYLGLSTSYLPIEGAPGGESRSDLVLTYRSNHLFKVEVGSTTFVGKENPSFTLNPEDFTLDDDESTAPPEVGKPLLILSPQNQRFLDGLSGHGEVQIFVFVAIPDQFLDQDYQGSIYFDARPE